MIVDPREDNALVCLFFGFVVVASLSAPAGLHSVVTNLLTSHKPRDSSASWRWEEEGGKG